MQKQYRSALRLFLAFLAVIYVDILNVELKHLLAFIQMLHNEKMSQATILNYVSAIKTLITRFSIPLDFYHQNVQSLLKSCARQPHRPVTIKNVLTVELLQELIIKTSCLQHPVASKAIFLFAFLVFFPAPFALL